MHERVKSYLWAGVLCVAAGLLVAAGGALAVGPLNLPAREAGQRIGGSVAQPPAVYRLHILPHSDDPHDQHVKEQVRDAVVDYLHRLQEERRIQAGPGWSRPVVTAAWMREHHAELAATAEQAVRRAGGEGTVTIETGPFWFEPRTMGGVVYPAGRYQATRMMIGAGGGGNWWCVVFAGMCVAGAWEEAKIGGAETVSIEMRSAFFDWYSARTDAPSPESISARFGGPVEQSWWRKWRTRYADDSWKAGAR